MLINTGAHLLISWALLSHTRWGKITAAILIGAFLPDALMFVFYAYQKIILAVPEQKIWQEAYYQPFWQNIFDVFNSIPLIIAALLVAYYKKWLFLQALTISMLIHCALDFPLHNDDAHRHFFPLSDWRFESPVSYWDPAHYGHYMVWFEILLIIASFIFIIRRRQEKVSRILAILLLIVNAIFFLFAMTYWLN